jgi:hypothetical protein
MDKRLADIIAENDKLRRDLENYKAATDRVGDTNEISTAESMIRGSYIFYILFISKIYKNHQILNHRKIYI